jgi:hypothetical protein
MLSLLTVVVVVWAPFGCGKLFFNMSNKYYCTGEKKINFKKY